MPCVLRMRLLYASIAFPVPSFQVASTTTITTAITTAIPAPLTESTDSKQPKMSSDELDDLPDFGRKPTASKRVMYMALSLFCVIPVGYLFTQIFLVDIHSSQVTLVLAVIVNSVLLSLAYHNLSFAKAARVRRTANPPTKNSFKGKKMDYEKAIMDFESSISRAALWHSCAYNNVIFMIVAPLLGVYLFSEQLSGDLNLLVSGAAAAALAVYNSNTALKAIGETQ